MEQSASSNTTIMLFWIVSEQPQSTAWTGFEDLGAAIGLCCVKEREEDIKVEEGDAEWGRKGR